MISGPKKSSTFADSDVDGMESFTPQQVTALFGFVPFPVIVSRFSDGRVLMVNDAFCQSVGFKREEVLGKTLTELNVYADPDVKTYLRDELQDKGALQGYRMRHLDRAGRTYENKISAKLIRFDRQVCVLTVTVHITPLKMAKQALRERDARFKDILQSIREGYYEVDLRGKLTFFNHAMEMLLGYAHDELRAKDYREYVSRDDIDLVRQAYRDVYDSGGGGKIIHYDVLRKDGRRISVETSLSLKRDKDRAPIGFYGIIRDRTAQKRVESAIAQSEEQHRNLLEMAPDAISVGTIPDWRYLQVNQALCRAAGYTAEEMIGRSAWELNLLVNPEDADALVKQMLETGRIEGQEVWFQDRHGNKHLHMLSARTIRYQGQDAWMAIGTDLSSLKKAQQANAANEERIHSILEEMEEGYYEVDLEGNYVFFNESTRQHHGYSRDELMGMNYTRFLPAHVASEARKRFIEIFQTGIPDKLFDYEILRKDGSTRLIEMSTYPKKDAQGQTVGFWGISRDRTERKRSELALRESEERLRSIFNTANEGIFVTRGGLIAFINPKTIEITGYASNELIGMPFADMVYPEDRETLHRKHQTLKNKDSSDSFTAFRILKKGVGITWVELSMVDIVWQGKRATLNFLRDIDLQRKMETQLLQAKKMEAIGTLAGGIAHDFNNLLMGIQGNLSLALMDVQKEQPIHRRLKNIEQYIKAGAELTRQLLATARGGKYEAKPTDLNRVVEKSADLFGRTKKDVRIHYQFADNLKTVEVDQGQIQQVLLNLFVNAWQAMPSGGDLYLSTHNQLLDEEAVKPYDIAAGHYVKLEVTDTGKGIDDEDLKRIFDPFFTTKGLHHGTGLGLASAYGIISNHGGLIRARSRKGQGATFEILLPASEKAYEGQAVSVEDIISGDETILLVDDEKEILEVEQRFLERLGYHVIAVLSGQEAVTAYRRKEASVDLVILDMIMPGMSGQDTFAALQTINPDVKVLLASGYSLDGQAKEILDSGCLGFIQKPFTLRTLSVKLREVLDGVAHAKP